MYKFLRIFFCILAVICAAVTILVFFFFSLWGLVPLCGAVVSAILMFCFKEFQESNEKKINSAKPKEVTKNDDASKEN